MKLIFEATDPHPMRRIARETGLDHTRLRRMGFGETPWNIEVVVALARRYGIPLPTAFLSAGWISLQEAEAMRPARALGRFADEDLLTEIARRMNSSEPRPQRAVATSTDPQANDGGPARSISESPTDEPDQPPPGAPTRCPDRFEDDEAALAAVVAPTADISHLRERLADATDARNRLVRQAKARGIQTQSIGAVLGVSSQRVSNILAEPSAHAS